MWVVVILQIEVKGHRQILMFGHCTATAHYHASNVAAVFSDCMLGEPLTASLRSNPWTSTDYYIIVASMYYVCYVILCVCHD